MLRIVLEDEDLTFRHRQRDGIVHAVQVATEEDILGVCELGSGVIGRGVVGRRVIVRRAGALGRRLNGFDDGPPSLAPGDVEHVDVSQHCDAVDLAGVDVVGQVDELVSLPDGANTILSTGLRQIPAGGEGLSCPR